MRASLRRDRAAHRAAARRLAAPRDRCRRSRGAERLRLEMRAWVEAELAPHAAEWEKAQFFPNWVLREVRGGGLDRAEVPEGAGRRRRSAGGRGVGAGAGALRLGRARRRDRRAHRHRAAAGVEVRHAPTSTSATSCRASAARRSRRSGSPSPTPARTSPASRRARGASRAASSSNGSKMFITNGVRADFVVTAVQDDRGGRPPRHLVPDRRQRRGRLARRRSRRWAGTRPTRR